MIDSCVSPTIIAINNLSNQGFFQLEKKTEKIGLVIAYAQIRVGIQIMVQRPLVFSAFFG